jgi:hypothetical protein
MKIFSRRDFIWILPLSLGLGAVLSSLQSGNWLIGWLGFSFLFLLSFSLLTLSTKWAGSGKVLAWMVILAFTLRFVGGVVTYLALPVYGYVDDEDQSAGFTYTDAHRRDAQAWDLASSELPIYDAFSKTYAYDQYGGLLAFSALVYRYLSPDEHRPLMLVLLSAFMAALALPFLWKAANQQWGAKVALVSGWIYALYPESILLGGSAMREPYLWAFSAFALWGFVNFVNRTPIQSQETLYSRVWLALGIGGMLLISPPVALATIIILVGWFYISSGHGRVSWWLAIAVVIVFIAGLFLLSSALDRNGELGGGSPIGIINNFMREAVKWDVYQLERDSGWVQKLFDEMPEWMRLPFVTVYGIFQPVLPAAFFEPTKLIWRIIAILRAVGWYTMLPALILSLGAAAGQSVESKRRLFLWLSFIVWMWIIVTALRGGGDSWDNPRYRTILFLWQAILAGNVWVWWRESKNAWFQRVFAMEFVFLIFFGQWYANRYIHFGPQLPFALMVMFIAASWAMIFLWGLWRDRKRSV